MKVILWNKKADREKKGDENTIVGKDGEMRWGETGNIWERKKAPCGWRKTKARYEGKSGEDSKELQRVKEKIHDTFE